MKNFSWNTTSYPLQLFSNTEFNFLTYILGNWTCIACDPSGEHLVVINSYLPLNNIFLSNNSGNTWTNLTENLGNINLSSVAITSNATNICLAAVRHALYISNNGGEQWNEYSYGYGYNSIACSSTAEIILVSYNNKLPKYRPINGGLLYSTNNGVDFNTITVPLYNWNCVCMNSQGSIMAACSSNGYCYVSTDMGSKWSATSLPTYNWNSISMDSTGSNIVICSLDGYVFFSNNSGSSWTSCAPANLNWNAIVISGNANIVFLTATNSSDIYFSSNNGVNWNTTSPNPNSTNWGSLCCNSDGSIVYACINGGYIYIGSLNS